MTTKSYAATSFPHIYVLFTVYSCSIMQPVWETTFHKCGTVLNSPKQIFYWFCRFWAFVWFPVYLFWSKLTIHCFISIFWAYKYNPSENSVWSTNWIISYYAIMFEIVFNLSISSCLFSNVPQLTNFTGCHGATSASLILSMSHVSLQEHWQEQ